MKSFLQKIPGWVQWTFLVLVGTFLMIWPAIYNGYPFVFSDTGAYINSAFSFIPPVDRSMWYGFFIRVTSLGYFIWGVVLAQALILVYLIIRTTQLFAKKIQPSTILLIVLGVVFFTPASWFASQIMMDIFAPVMILAAGLFIFGKFVVWERIWLGFLIAITISMHIAHPLILLFTLAVTALVIFKLFASVKQVIGWYKRIAAVVGILVLTTVVMMSVNLFTYGQFTLNPSGHVFLMARLTETQMLKDYLGKNCGVNEWTLCEAYPRLPYSNVEAFLWNPESIVNKVGWKESKVEYDHVIQGVLMNPMNFGSFALDSLSKGVQLLTYFTLDSFYPQTLHSPPFDQIRKKFPQDVPSYIASRQYNGTLNLLSATEILQFICFLLSCGLLMYDAWKGFASKSRPFVVLVISGVVMNALIMGGLSGVFGRYQARICWLMVLVALIGYLTSDQQKDIGK